MKAVVYSRYGSPDVLQLKEIPKPVPNDDQLLIKIYAASINGSDREGLIGTPLYSRIGGLFRPGNPILGSDIAGQVEWVGKNNKEFQAGDEVFGELPGYHGGFAEYARTSGKTLMRKPAGMSFEEAAAIPQGGVIALRGIRVNGRVQPGQQVLINGAGGSAGTFAVQLAKHHGAEVTAVDNAFKTDFLQSLGADHVIDYARENFTKNGKRYDLILDLIAHRSVFDYRRALKPGGTYYLTGGSMSALFQVLLLGPMVGRKEGKKIRLLGVPQSRKDLVSITELCETGAITPVIDRRFPLNETPDAFRYINAGHAKGKVVIAIVVPST
jgi:NADPH:quinone reductase-like Zn-dependent oxidoreductase